MSDCLFCKIINNEIPSTKIYEDEKVLAFNDINPQSPVHILIIPKKHIASMNDFDETNIDILSHIFLVIKNIAKDKGLKEKGYRIVNNCGEQGGQTVDHIHFHLLGGQNMYWPSG